jgi:hypothetical protein
MDFKKEKCAREGPDRADVAKADLTVRALSAKEFASPSEPGIMTSA